MKIIKVKGNIENVYRCIDNICGYFDWYVESDLRTVKYCMKKQRRIKNPKMIPSWCPLEDTQKNSGGGE